MTGKPDLNARIIHEFRANKGGVGGGFSGAPLLLLHTVGTRSGRSRVNPMMYLADRGRFLVFASKASSDRNPDRYHNRLARPEARIEVGDAILAVRAAKLRGTERDTAFAEQARRCPGFAGYRSKTERVIPVIALIALGEGAESTDQAERTPS
jgi:deazaflavin-dependent oxidoreductase (nitroreductase family)